MLYVRLGQTEKAREKENQVYTYVYAYPPYLRIAGRCRVVLRGLKGLKPGKYVLGWRYDCEETAQVWQNCADVKVVAEEE